MVEDGVEHVPADEAQADDPEDELGELLLGSMPRCSPWRIATTEPMYTPSATSVPNGLIDGGWRGSKKRSRRGTA